MKHCINIKGIRLYAFHGCMQEESKIGSEYEINISVKLDLETASKTDSLKDTVDYVVLNQIIKEQMSIRSKLLETVVRRIGNEILRVYPKIITLQVAVTKLNPPINGNVQGVELVEIFKN